MGEFDVLINQYVGGAVVDDEIPSLLHQQGGDTHEDRRADVVVANVIDPTTVKGTGKAGPWVATKGKIHKQHILWGKVGAEFIGDHGGVVLGQVRAIDRTGKLHLRSKLGWVGGDALGSYHHIGWHNLNP